MDRRSFIKGLIRVGACVAFDPHRVIFDMAKGLYLPQPSTWGMGYLQAQNENGEWVGLGRVSGAYYDVRGDEQNVAEALKLLYTQRIRRMEISLGDLRRLTDHFLGRLSLCPPSLRLWHVGLLDDS